MSLYCHNYNIIECVFSQQSYVKHCIYRCIWVYISFLNIFFNHSYCFSTLQLLHLVACDNTFVQWRNRVAAIVTKNCLSFRLHVHVETRSTSLINWSKLKTFISPRLYKEHEFSGCDASMCNSEHSKGQNFNCLILYKVPDVVFINQSTLWLWISIPNVRSGFTQYSESQIFHNNFKLAKITIV